MNVGIVLPNLGPIQSAYRAIAEVHRMLDKTNNYDFVLFYEDLVPAVNNPLCATMNIAELYNFNGTIISTNIKNTISVNKSLINGRHIFYVWDLEWQYPHGLDYMYCIQAFRNDNIELVSRSLSHAQAIDNYCNRKVDKIVPNFNLEKILE